MHYSEMGIAGEHRSRTSNFCRGLPIHIINLQILLVLHIHTMRYSKSRRINDSATTNYYAHSHILKHAQVPEKTLTKTGNGTNTTTMTALAILFGILFAITLIAFIGYIIRQIQQRNDLMPSETITAQPPASEPEALYSVVNRSANRRATSEREVVVNEIYAMS